MVARYFREVVEWFDSNALDYRDVAQLVERYIRDVEVAGSSPVIPIFFPHLRVWFFYCLYDVIIYFIHD